MATHDVVTMGYGNNKTLGYDEEKLEKAYTIEHVDSLDSNELKYTSTEAADNAAINAFTPAEQRKIVRKIDRRLVLTLGVLYCASLMDRTNLGSASIAGMSKDLGLSIGVRYSLITLIFFIPYVLFQPPATVVLRKVGPRIFLAAICIAWGATMICFGFVNDWTVMMGLRVILGVLEAGFFPGCAYLLSTWYPRYELQKRNAVFYLIGSMASAISGILAYGISQITAGGYAGWKWIFFLEGAITVFAGICGYFLIVDFPELAHKSWRFLTEKEAAFVVARIQLDRHDAEVEPFHLGSYLKNALDSKVWAFAWLFMLTTTNTYAIAYFLPIILKDGMGFSYAASQCLVAPPYVFAGIVMFSEAWVADKYHIRGPIVIFNACLGIIGLPLLGYTTNNGLRYFGVFLATIAGNANVPSVLTYQANNIRGQWKRALTSATLVGAGGVGGIIGSTVFRAVDAPKYGPGILCAILANALIVVIVLGLSLKFWRANKRAAAGGKVIEGLAGFRYTL